MDLLWISESGRLTSMPPHVLFHAQGVLMDCVVTGPSLTEPHDTCYVPVTDHWYLGGELFVTCAHLGHSNDYHYYYMMRFYHVQTLVGPFVVVASHICFGRISFEQCGMS